MTTRTRRALNRVRNHARSFVRAVDDLKPADMAELSWWTRRTILRARIKSEQADNRLTNLLDHGGQVVPGVGRYVLKDSTGVIQSTLTVGGYAGSANTNHPTLASVGDYRADDQADEARDVAREMAARDAGDA